MEQQDWKKDPRLQTMEEEKLRLLTELFEEAKKASPSHLIPLLLKLTKQSELNFSDSETDLLFSVLTANLTPAQKKQADMLRMFSKQLK